MDTHDMLDAICPACRATCGLGAPRSVSVDALCDAHREYVERHGSHFGLRMEPSYSWRSVNEPWPEVDA